ncbi:cyanophycin synthetase family protein [Rhizobium leguminosarum]|uniref:cyanophycin synthetase family protein n=1 Tax=Rhizobium leguminosarum TaxID=384 RepID=UPI0021B09DB4|nr:hypothetical protein [Rhizobium leguminosarum]
MEQYPTNLLPGFVDALLKHVPGLREHGCSYGEPGGLVLRMEEGTWLGHVAEHVAIELQNIAGADVARGKTRSVTNMPGVSMSCLNMRMRISACWRDASR